MKIEQLVEVGTTLEETLDELDEKGFSVAYLKVRIEADPSVDVVVTANHDVYAVRVGAPI